MRKNWKRILASFLAACIIFSDSSLVYAVESSQNDADTSIVEEVSDEILDEVQKESAEQESIKKTEIEDVTASDEETYVLENDLLITEEDLSEPIDEAASAKESAEENVSDATSEELISVETFEETVGSEVLEVEAPVKSETEIYQISPVTEVCVNPLYEDVIDEEDILNSVAATLQVDEPEVYTNVDDIIEMVREELVERNANIVFAYEYAYDGSFDAEEVEALMDEIIAEAIVHTGNPKEGDYLKWNYAGYTQGYSGHYSSTTVHLEFSYIVSWYTSAEMETEMDVAVDRVLSSLQLEGMNEYEQIKSIYDYICANVTYDYTNLKNDSYLLKYTPYAALINGTSVCQGYATLFYRLALEADLDVRVISGDAGGAHAWNIVRLYGSYYNMDATWDAPRAENGYDYKYFLQNMDEFSDHVRAEEYLTDSFMEEYSMAEASYVEEEEKLPMPDLRFYYDEEDELTGIAVENMASEDAEIVYGLVDEYYLDDIENYGHPASTFIIQSDDIYTISLETLTIFALMDGWDVDATYYLYAHLEDSEGNIISDINVMDSYPVTIGERNVMEEVSVRVSEDGNCCYYNDITEKEYAQLLAIISHENEYGLTTSCYAAPREKGVFYFNKEDFIKAYGEDYLTETIYATGYSLGDGIASGMNLFWDVVPVDADSYIVEEAQQNVSISLQTDEYGNAEAVVLSNDSSEILDLGLCAITEDEENYRYLASSEVAAGETVTYYLNDYADTFDDAEPGTYHLYTYAIDPETYEESAYVALEDFTLEVSRENADPVIAAVDDSTGIWHFTEYALDEYVDAQIFMGRTLANIWSIEVGEDTEVSDYFYLDIDQILDDMGWSGYEIENIIFLKTVAGSNYYEIQQYEGTEFEFTTYEDGSEDEEEPDDDVDDNVFVLNKVYSTGSSDDWQDLYYTYYFTPEESGYYGVKGNLFSVYVYGDDWDAEKVAYIKYSEEGNIEKYFYLESGETYRFQLNIEVDAYTEEYYQLVRDTEGENIPILTVSGDSYSLESGEERMLKIQVSEAGLYFVSINGYNHYIRWEEVIGENDYAAESMIYFAEPGYAYFRIETEEDVTIELKALNPQSLDLDEEITVQAETDACYEIDVTDHNIVYLKKNNCAYELVGVDEDGVGHYIDSYWINENDENCVILKTPSYVKTLFIFFEGKYQTEDETMVVASSYEFENQLTDWSGNITVPANAEAIFEYSGDVYGDYFISEPIGSSWDYAWFESLCEDGEIRALWGTEELDGKAYKGYSYRYYDSEKEMKSHMIFKIYNYTDQELTFELKTNEDFETWELYDEGDGHTEVDVNYNYYDNDYGTYYSYYTFTPEITKLYNFHECSWIYRLSDRRLMPKFNVILEAGETYYIRFKDTYGMEDINVVQQSGSEVRFSLDENIVAFTPDVSGDYYIEVPGTLKLWNAETLSFDNITTQSKIALEAGGTYIFWSRRGEGQIGMKSEITVLDYDYYHALIASGGSVSIVDGELQIKEPIFGGFTLKEALLSLLGLGTYGNQPRDAFMKANQYWVGESGAFASSEYYKLSEEGTLVDCSEDTVCAGDILVVKYEPEIVWVDSMKITVDSTELYEGQTAQLSVEVAPATDKYDFKETPELRFESSDPEIADVDENGVVTPYRPGTVTITVYADETLRWREGLRDQILSESIELTVTGKQFTVLDYDYLQAFIASGGSVSLDADGSLKIEQKKSGWNLISMVASFFGISTYEEIPEETYIESNYYWLTEENESFVPVGYYDLEGNDISKEQAEAGGYAVVKYEPEYVWVDHFDMEVEDDILTAGESTTLTVTPYAATEKYGFKETPEIRLESTNPRIADVLADGTIETYKAGTVLIRAYADETLKYEMGLGHTIVSDYVVITVEPQPVEATLTYEILENDTITITGYEGELQDKLVIPEQIDGYTVSAIGEYAFEVDEYNDYAGINLTEVVLPDTITSIGFCAFANCSNLKKINIPDSVESIDNAAFRYCSSLESLVLPEGITNVGTFAFWACTSLTELVIPKSLTTVQWGAFYQCENLKKVTILGEDVTIEEDAFADCTKLEEVDVQENLTYIGGYAFFNCTSLKEIVLQNSVEEIGSYAFSKGDIEIGSETFENMDITIYASRRSYAYEWAVDNEFTVVDTDAGKTFYEYEIIDDEEKTIRITGMDGKPEGDCVIPKEIDGYTVVEIGDYAFNENYASDEGEIGEKFNGIVTIPNTVVSIGKCAFECCDGIEEIIIPDSVKYIADDAFLDCYKLKYVYLSNNIEFIGDCAFSSDESGWYKNLNIIINASPNHYAGQWAIENGFKIGEPGIEENGFVYRVLDDNTVSIIGYTDIPGDKVTIPTELGGYSVSEIADYAFANAFRYVDEDESTWDPLKVTLPEGLKRIESHAFLNCGRVGWELIIPDSVTEIGKNAFNGCSFITELTLPSNITEIPEGAFKYCWIEDLLIIPEKVTKIGEEAFFGCDMLSRVHLPNGLTSIGDLTFSYKCSQTEYGNLAIRMYADNGTYGYQWAVENGFDIVDTTLSGVYEFTYEVLEDGTASITGYEGTPGGDLIIPSEIDGYTVTAISDDAFMDEVDFMGKLVLPETLKEIGDRAFYDCRELNGQLIIPDGVTAIGESAFCMCESFTGELVIPDSVTELGVAAFQLCSKIENIVIGSGISRIESYAFAECEGLTTLDIPENIETIGNCAFIYCYGLTDTLVIPENVTRIESDAFAGCWNIKDVYLSETIEEIGEYAFSLNYDYGDCGPVDITLHCVENSYAFNWAVANGFKISTDMTIVGHYKISYMTNGGTILDGSVTEYEEGVGAVLPTNVTKEGYTFEGWYADETFSGSRVYSIGKDEAGNKTFFAKWKAKNYKIDYELNGGTNNSKNPTDYTVEDTIVLYDPVREGYDFLGWYDENGNLVQRVEDLTGDQKIHAEWNPKDYDINYNGNGGTIKGDYVPSYDIESDTIVLPDIEKDHYEFDGWYTDEKYTEKVSVIPAGSTGDRTFYAKWKPIKYSISYEADGGLVEAGAAESYTIESADITLPTANKQGYRFDGWYENEEFTGNSVTVIPKGSTGNKTFYAKWVVNQYSIVFDTAGGSKIDMITQDYASEVTAPADPVREGYTFVGWDKEIPTTMPARNMTVTAQWKINQYTITFDAAGGSEIAAITQDYASEVTAPAAPAREGYTFVGWDKEIPATMPARNMTITAQWKINQYTITFDTAGGSPVASITADYGSMLSFFPPERPVKNGYTFVGWDKEIPTTMPAENITITALWELTNYTITYHVNGGTLSEDTVYPETFTVEGRVELPAPIRYGYQFAGWYTDEAFTEDTKVDTIPAGIADNLNVYAKWEFAAKLSLKLNNDGSVITHPYNKATKEWNYKDVTYTIETDTEGILINKDYYNAEEGYSVVAELYKVDADGTETLINIYYNTDQVIKAEDIDEQGDYLLTGTYRHPGEEVKEMTPVTFTVDYEKREYPVNKDLEWYGLSGNEERDQFGEIKPLLLELMQPTEDVLNSTIGEELVEDGTIVIKNAKNKEVKDTDALASGTYQVIYQIEHERFLEEAVANVIISYGTITADSVRYAAIDTEEELDDMGRTAGSTIAFEEDYINSTQYTTGVVIVPVFKTPWGVLAANELEETLNEKGYEGYTVSIEEVTETAKKEILELEPICFQGSSNATACAVTGTAKGKSSLKISTVIWDADDNQVTEITTNVKTITVVEGSANIVSEITLDLYDDLENYVDAYSESEDGVKTYLFAKDDRARSYSFELCAFTYAGDDASDAVFKWKSSSSIASVKTDKSGVTTLIIPKNAQGVADITVTANDSGKKAQIIKIVIVDAGMRLDTTSLTMNSLRPDSQQAVADLYPNVLAAEVNGMTVEDLFTNIGLYTKKDLDAVSEIFETDYDYETGELKIFFADSYLEELQSQTKTAAKTHTVYVGVESSLEDAEPEFYKLTIKDQCALPKKPTLKLKKNYEAAYASGYAEYTLTLNAPAAMRDDGETPAIWIDEDQKFEIFEWEDLSDGNGTSWKLKVRAKDYTVLPDAKKNAKTTKGINFNVEYDEYMKGHTVTVSITVKKSIPKFTVYGADTFTPVYYAETGYRYVNVVIPVEAGLVEGMITDGTYEELSVSENEATLSDLLSISVKDKNRFELVKAEYFAEYGTVPAKKGSTEIKEAFALTVKVVEPAGTKAKDAKLQFVMESDNLKNSDGTNIQITTSALTVKSRKASSDTITVVDKQSTAVKTLTFNSTLAGKESITLYVNGSNELKLLAGLNDVKTVISVEGSDANSKKILKNNALLLSVDEENGEFTITSTSEAFKYSSCKLKVTMLLEGPEGTAATKNATVTLSFKKSLTPKVTLNAVKLYRGLEKYTEETDDVMTVNYLTDVTAVKAKVTNMPIGSFISNVRFADVADYSKYELFDFRMYDGGFQIGLSKYAQPVLGKDKVDMIYDITTATGDMISVNTTVNITVADSISMKVDTKSINLYNSAVGPAYGKNATFSDAKGHAVEVLEIVNAEELAKAGIGIDLEQTSEDEKCGADTVRFFVDSELKRGKETTYTVKAKVALVDSVTEQDGTFVTTTAAEKIVTLKIVLKK